MAVLILGQIYPLKKAIFDQFYQHRKELSYTHFKDLYWKWHGMRTKMGACRILGYDFGVYKHSLNELLFLSTAMVSRAPKSNVVTSPF